MENDILDALQDVGYKGPLTEEVALSKALDGGAKSPEYTKLVHILCDELRSICRLEEAVNLTQDAEEASCFLLELSSFLKEIGCPYTSMISGHVSGRLQSRADRILLLDYLLSELMAARMVNIDKPDKDKDELEVVMQESPTARDLKNILISLKFNKPPANISAEVLFNKVYAKLKETIDKDGVELAGKPLYNKGLTEKQWKELDTTFREMLEEYRLRRETLITRLDCTIQSFEWSDKARAKRDSIQAVYRPKRAQMKPKPDVSLSDFLAARDSLLHVEKTSSAAVRKNTQSEVNKVVIGRVPDRGGRPSEQQPPPPEMPSWQNRAQGGGAPGGGRGGGRGGGQGGGRGGFQGGGQGGGRGGGTPRGGGGAGRVQGGWSQGDGNRSQGQNRPQSAQQQSNNNSYQHQPNQNYRGQGQSPAYQKQASYSNQNNYQTSSPYGGAQSFGYERSTQQTYSTQGSLSSQQGGYSSQQGGYSSQQGSVGSQPGGYSSQQGGGYSSQQGGYGSQQGRGYQNEHDNRTSQDYDRGQSGQRGRSNYNRGGRY